MTSLGFRKVNRTGRSTGVRKANRFTKLTKPFAPRPIRMLESPAWRVTSLTARRVLDRIEIELAAHGGQENGRLPVTYDDFERYGCHRHAIAAAIRELVALGLLRVTEAGRAGNAEWRRPNLFRLTYLSADNGPPTNEWARIETLGEAKAKASDARS